VKRRRRQWRCSWVLLVIYYFCIFLNEKRRRLYRFCGLLRARVASWRLGDSREDQKEKWQGHFGVKLRVVQRGTPPFLNSLL
jgi:hypothetical protein